MVGFKLPDGRAVCRDHLCHREACRLYATPFPLDSIITGSASIGMECAVCGKTMVLATIPRRPNT